MLLFHISNRFFDLEPVLSTEAKARGWTAAIRMDPISEQSTGKALTASNWVALTATAARIQALTSTIQPRDKAANDGVWVPLESRPGFTRWTDDYASTLPIMLWGHLLGKNE